MKSLYQKNKVTDIEYKIYNDWFIWILEQFKLPEFKFIYLKLSTDLCSERIKIRNREEENDIDYEYLNFLNNNHDMWLSTLNKNECLTLDGTYDNTNQEELNVIYENINIFIKQ
jgi:deoxyadenosine/deoxycytidine kinase